MADQIAEEKKQFNTLEEVKEDEARRVAGGWYVGSDKYTLEEYSRAGITWEHNVWSKDRYFIRGAKIDQALAERITDNSLMLGRLLTDDELRILGVNL
ncbi:hypothetical protein HCH52_11810 [Oscillospiraceae bacterium HV4-5-C5C]|nr:hypothetical protein [Oscillospiraceae bacterium HV4-5-C5C]